MTRERKEIQKKMVELEMQEQADYELGCGYCAESIQEAFAPYWDKLYEAWAATYGQTPKEHDKHIYTRQCEAYEAGRIPWSPCYGFSYM